MIVIRHGRAGDREEWTGNEKKRPLDKKGRKQAKQLVKDLAGKKIERILSSPYDRCVQTVEPLARARGLKIEISHWLGEERQIAEGVQFAKSLIGKPVALCVHGGFSETLVEKPLKKGRWLEA